LQRADQTAQPSQRPGKVPLTAHLDHGQTRLDNNPIENAIRPSAIGKKNWLFIGHPSAVPSFTRSSYPVSAMAKIL
jgi:hypothetical protein